MPYATILETRVKENNVNKVRKVFGSNWKWLDNYTHHPNCTIWIMWKEGNSDISNKESSDQYIHYKVNNVSNSYALIVIYAHNQLINRRKEYGWTLINWPTLSKVHGCLWETSTMCSMLKIELEEIRSRKLNIKT